MMTSEAGRWARLSFLLLAAVLAALLQPLPCQEYSCDRLDPRSEVLRFLQASDVGSQALLLHVQEVICLPPRILKVTADFLTMKAGHPLDGEPLSAIERHRLTIVFDAQPLPLHTSPGEIGSPLPALPVVLYAQDTHTAPMGKTVAELPWDYRTGTHILLEPSLDGSTAQRKLRFEGRTYHPVQLAGAPEASDYSPLLRLGAVGGREVFTTLSPTASLIIPEDGVFWPWLPVSP
ncbi:MAG: hypothetical protein NTV14_02630 [Coprothermobacterota bacterium]|nr:hypothetical protein [Coprothermobacterota bacterium]